ARRCRSPRRPPRRPRAPSPPGRRRRSETARGARRGGRNAAGSHSPPRAGERGEGLELLAPGQEETDLEDDPPEAHLEHLVAKRTDEELADPQDEEARRPV